MISEGNFKTDSPTPGSLLERREALEQAHGVRFTLRGQAPDFTWVATWRDPETSARKVSSPSTIATLVRLVGDLFAGTLSDHSWYRDAEARDRRTP